MKTKRIIALLIAIVAFSACKKQETVTPGNEIIIEMSGGIGAAIVFDGRVYHRMNAANNSEKHFTLPIGANFFYKNRIGNCILTVYVNGEKQDSVIQLSDGDLEYHEYVIGSGTILKEVKP